MRRFVCFTAVCAFLFVFCAAAFAAELTADTVTKEGSKTRNGKIYVKDSKVRVERQGSPLVSVARGDKGLLWQMNVYERTYVEGKLTPATKPPVDEKLFGETARKQVGQETVNGFAAKKFEVQANQGKKTETFYQWWAADLGFPVKVAKADGSWSIEYKNIKKGGVDPNLFEIPKGFDKDATAVPDTLSH